ncbi:MAG: hypothetical protein AMS24_00135 [Chlamydiae bacterium SM23_39]|nr:MAG: hypothetical protein AMS24_00135 [Chlamydiae bacterium SM23_39]
MQNASIVILNEFLKKFAEKKRKNMLSFLSDEIRKKIEKTPHLKVSIDFEKFEPQNIIKEIHYSWYLPFLKKFPKKQQLWFLSLLEKNISEKLKNFLQIKEKIKKLPIFFSFFLQKIFFKEILDDYILPKEYLVPSKLNFLLNLSKNNLIKLINFLALFDLAKEIPKIIDTKILKKIDKHLSKEEKIFLHSKIKYKESFSFPKLQINKYINSKEAFKLMLHKRGIIRFAKALSTQDNNLIWHISRKLDIGRGKILYELSQKDKFFEISKSITSNIIQILPIITKEEEYE